MLVDLAKTLKVTSDELLGVKEKATPRKARLWKRLEKVDDLPPSDQRAALKFVDALVTSRQAAG